MKLDAQKAFDDVTNRTARFFKSKTYVIGFVDAGAACGLVIKQESKDGDGRHYGADGFVQESLLAYMREHQEEIIKDVTARVEKRVKSYAEKAIAEAVSNIQEIKV